MNVALTLVEEPFGGPGATVLFPKYVAAIQQLYPEWGPQVPPTLTAEDVEPPRGCWLVAYRDSEPVGCAALKRLDLDAAELKRLFVVPEARGTGIARALIARLEQIGREAGYAAIRLDTGARQPGAAALFRSSGYHEIGDYNGNPAAAFWFQKSLDES
jgi:GNAT superfamily N-acetyltransferase